MSLSSYISSKVNSDVDTFYKLARSYARKHFNVVEWLGGGDIILVKQKIGLPVFRIWMNTKDAKKVESFIISPSKKGSFEGEVKNLFEKQFPNITWEEVVTGDEVYMGGADPAEMIKLAKKSNLSPNQRLHYVDIGLGEIEGITNDEREDLRDILESLDGANKFLLARAWCQLAVGYFYSKPDSETRSNEELKKYVRKSKEEVNHCLDKAKELVGEYEPTVAATTMDLMREEMDEKSYLALGKRLIDKNIYNIRVIELYLKALKGTGKKGLVEKTLNEILSKNEREGYFDKLLSYISMPSVMLSVKQQLVLIFGGMLLLGLYFVGSLGFFKYFSRLTASLYSTIVNVQFDAKEFSIFGILFAFLFVYSFLLLLHRYLIKKSKWYLINVYPIASQIQIPMNVRGGRASGRLIWHILIAPLARRIHKRTTLAMIISFALLVVMILIGAD